MLNSFFDYIEAADYGIFLLSVIIILCTFILEDPTTLFVGHLIAVNKISYSNAFLALMIGISLGDFFLYLTGRYLGGKKFKWSTALQNIKMNLYSLLFLARFIPGMRVTFYPFAGIKKVRVSFFLVINILSSIIWTALLLAGAKNISTFLQDYPFYYFVLFILGVIGLELLIKRLVFKKMSAKHS